jgi:hypothetical protein
MTSMMHMRIADRSNCEYATGPGSAVFVRLAST